MAQFPLDLKIFHFHYFGGTKVTWPTEQQTPKSSHLQVHTLWNILDQYILLGSVIPHPSGTPLDQSFSLIALETVHPCSIIPIMPSLGSHHPIQWCAHLYESPLILMDDLFVPVSDPFHQPVCSVLWGLPCTLLKGPSIFCISSIYTPSDILSSIHHLSSTHSKYYPYPVAHSKLLPLSF